MTAPQPVQEVRVTPGPESGQQPSGEQQPAGEQQEPLSPGTVALFRDLIIAAAMADDPDAAWERTVASAARQILAVTAEFRRAFLAGLRAAGYPVPERKPPGAATWPGTEWSADPEYELDPAEVPGEPADAWPHEDQGEDG